MNKQDQASYKKIKLLWDTIPSFNCRAGCSGCCGVIMMSRVEWEAIHPHLPQISINCPYLKAGRCSIYNYRPSICRLFGVVDNPLLRCHHGGKASKILTNDQAKKLLDDVSKLGA